MAAVADTVAVSRMPVVSSLVIVGVVIVGLVKPVTVKNPVDGLNWYLVELVNSAVKLPVVTAANSG